MTIRTDLEELLPDRDSEIKALRSFDDSEKRDELFGLFADHARDKSIDTGVILKEVNYEEAGVALALIELLEDEPELRTEY
jgi:hypothetical protein